MAFDEALADRIREVLASRSELSANHARPMDFTGKPAKSMVYVHAEGTASDPPKTK